MDFRIGQGYDVHRLVKGSDLILGGIKIDHPKGLKGHSDADVLLHAICDGILGAANQGDIGQHFPPSDPTYKAISSIKLLDQVYQMVKQSNFTIGNIDATVCLEAPKLGHHIPFMKKAIAESLGISAEFISIKATTTEQLGPEGNEEGISAMAVVLLKKVD